MPATPDAASWAPPNGGRRRWAAAAAVVMQRRAQRAFGARLTTRRTGIDTSRSQREAPLGLSGLAATGPRRSARRTPGTAPKAVDVITPQGVSRLTALDPTLGTVAIEPVTVRGLAAGMRGGPWQGLPRIPAPAALTTS